MPWKELVIVGATTLLAVAGWQSVAAGQDDNPGASWRSGAWPERHEAMGQAWRERAAEAPYGPDVIASRPVPDTPRNRLRFGEPMSHAGRMTAPDGD